MFHITDWLQLPGGGKLPLAPDFCDALLLTAAAWLCLLAPRLGARWWCRLERPFSRLARRPRLALATIAGAALALNAALSLLGHMPQPYVHDEFSYLLAADTYAHGRLTNPTHPMWLHFETFHVIQHPSYASKYPPGQGALLALGQVLTGYPIVGAWLGGSLACALLYWMLLAWVPRRYALLGGMLAVIAPLFLQWSQSYWGGGLAVAAGCLTLGAMRRLLREPARARDGWLMGLGIALLLVNRPYEGTLLSALCLAVLTRHAIRLPTPGLRDFVRRVLPPVGCCLLATAGFLAYLNWRVTGHALLMPYAVHEAQYGIAPLFLWGHARPIPHYNHRALLDFHTKIELAIYRRYLAPGGLMRMTLLKLLLMAEIPCQLLITGLALAFVPAAARRDRWMRLLLLMWAVFSLGQLVAVYDHEQYAAPVVGVIFVLLINGLCRMRVWRIQGQPVGRALLRAALCLSVLSLPGTCRAIISHRADFAEQRAAIIADLMRQGGRHLVVVRYAPWHDSRNEWVFNAADIDAAPVVWARDMDAAHDRRLLAYFSDRKVWLLRADLPHPHLEPFAPTANSATSAQRR